MADSRDFDWRNAPITSGGPWDDSEELPDAPSSPLPPGSYGVSAGQPAGLSTGLMGEAAQAPSVTDIRPEDDGKPALPCLSGPCRHYCVIGQTIGVVGSLESRKEYRYCKMLHELSGTMTLQELTIRFCSDYAPPLWSPAGWWQLLRDAPLRMKSARRFHYAPGLRTRILHQINLWLGDRAPEVGWVREAEDEAHQDWFSRACNYLDRPER